MNKQPDEPIVDLKSDMDQDPVPCKTKQPIPDPTPVVVTYYTIEQFKVAFDHSAYPMVMKGSQGVYLLRTLYPHAVENYVCIPIAWMSGVVRTQVHHTHVILPCKRTADIDTRYIIERTDMREKDNIIDFIAFVSSGQQIVPER